MQLTIEQALERAIAAHKEGKLNEAENIYRAILQSQPNHPEVNHNLGLIAVSVNQIESAIPLFKTALDTNSNVELFWLSYVEALVRAERQKDAKQAIKKAKEKGFDAKKLEKLLSQSPRGSESGAEVHFNLGNTLYLQGRLSEAEASYGEAIALKPDYAEAHYNSGVVKQALGRLSEAEASYSQAVALKPDYVDAHYNSGIVKQALGRLSEAEASYKQAIALKPDHAEIHFNLGNTLLGLGKVQGAEASYNQAIALKPEFAEAHNNLGLAVQGLGRLSEAEASFNQAIAWKTDYAEAHNNLGNTLQGLGRLSEAEASYNRAIALKPEFAEAHNNLGNTLQGLGRLIEAEASYNQAIAFKTDYAEAHSNLGNTLQGLGRLSEAEASFNHAIVLKPDYAEAHNNLGNTLQGLGRLSEAEASFNQAIVLRPDYAEAHNNLGLAFAELGKLTQAEASFYQAIALKPHYADAYNNLGVSLQGLGRLKEAETNFNQAIALEPDHAEAHNNLGGTLRGLGRLSEAEASFTEALALNPDYSEAQHNLISLLTIYTSQNKSSQPIARVHQQIREFDSKEKIFGIISDNKTIDLINKTSDIVRENNLDLETSNSQIYRRNSVDLNCDRHMAIFDAFNIIPEFCFGCYKVQVEPRSLLELVKLSVVFDQIKLSGNNTRKCMIEIRPFVPGFYKGLIYCNGLSEAYQIAEKLEIIVEERIGSRLPLTVKRGCSEYPISFPDYKKINKSGAQPMNYNREWASIEKEYDAKQPIKNQMIVSPTLSSLSLSDVLIFRNWIDYARGIGDSSVLLLDHSEIGSQEMYEIAKSRLETYPWLQSAGPV